MAKSDDVGLESLRQTLRSLLSPCFGPLGSDVLVARNTGGSVSGNNGYFLLDSVQLRQPCATLALNAAKSRHQDFGDGSSALLLCLAEALGAVERRLASIPAATRPYMQARVARAISRVRGELLPTIVVPRLAEHCSQHACVSEDGGADTATRLNGMTEALCALCKCVLCQRFSPATCRELTRLVVETVDALLPSADLAARLTQLIWQFQDETCYEVPGDVVSSSRLLRGCLLPVAARRHAECNKWLAQHSHPDDDDLCVVYFLDTAVSHGMPATFVVEASHHLSSLLSWQLQQGERIATAIATEHQHARRKLLVTSSSSEWQGLAESVRRNGIFALECDGGGEKLHSLAARYGIPVCDPNLFIAEHYACITDLQALSISQQIYLHVGTRTCTQSRRGAGSGGHAADVDSVSRSARPLANGGTAPPPLSVLICGSTPQLCHMYSDCVLACLRAMRASVESCTAAFCTSPLATAQREGQETTRPLATAQGEGQEMARPKVDFAPAEGSLRAGEATRGPLRQLSTADRVAVGQSQLHVGTGNAGSCENTATRLPAGGSSSVMTVVPGGGLSELVMSTVLIDFGSLVNSSTVDPATRTGWSRNADGQNEFSTHSAAAGSMLDLKEASLVIGHALSVVPKLLHGQVERSAGIGNCRYLTCQAQAHRALLEMSKVASVGNSCSVLSAGASVWEPFAAKRRLAEDLCSLLEQLLRIEFVVRCRSVGHILRCESKGRLKPASSRLSDSDEEENDSSNDDIDDQ